MGEKGKLGGRKAGKTVRKVRTWEVWKTENYKQRGCRYAAPESDRVPDRASQDQIRPEGLYPTDVSSPQVICPGVST